MWRIGHRHELPHLFEVVQVLQAKPYRFGAGSTIAFASEIAAESSYPCNGLTQCRRISWGNGFFLDMGIKCLPFGPSKNTVQGTLGVSRPSLTKWKTRQATTISIARQASI